MIQQLTKQIGTNTFVPTDENGKDVSHLDDGNSSVSRLAEIYSTTENSLREQIKKAMDTDPSKIQKLEKDLKDFYDSIGKKYSMNITTRNDFLNLMGSLASFDKTKQKAADLISKHNEAIDKKKQPKEYNTEDLIGQASQKADEVFSARLMKGKIDEKTAVSSINKMRRNNGKDPLDPDLFSNPKYAKKDQFSNGTKNETLSQDSRSQTDTECDKRTDDLKDEPLDKEREELDEQHRNNIF